MNKKLLKKLCDESMEPSGLEGLGGSYMDFNEETFAELIIKECINVIHLNKRCPNGYIGSHDAGFQLGCNLSIENIEKHFGIK